MTSPLHDAALEYHRQPTHGKISVVPTKPMATQRDQARRACSKAPECFIVERKLRARMKVPARGRCRAFHL